MNFPFCMLGLDKLMFWTRIFGIFHQAVHFLVCYILVTILRILEMLLAPLYDQVMKETIFQSIKTLKNKLKNLAREWIIFIQMIKLFTTKVVHYNKRKVVHYMPLFSRLQPIFTSIQKLSLHLNNFLWKVYFFQF